MKAVERIVEHVLRHREELSNFGRIAVEVYIAYILERVIEHFHAVIGSCLGLLMEKVSENWEHVTEEVLPGILEKIKKTSAKLLLTAKSLLTSIFQMEE
ncbi:MAG TPA: hypothetical protein VJW95_04710 [Dissulfurispiraceae bacterium]|nr:hypothetical protein [Dissulfurispiraceae bacterium]